MHFKTDKLPVLLTGVMPGMAVYLAVTFFFLVLSRNCLEIEAGFRCWFSKKKKKSWKKPICSLYGK